MIVVRGSITRRRESKTSLRQVWDHCWTSCRWSATSWRLVRPIANHGWVIG